MMWGTAKGPCQKHLILKEVVRRPRSSYSIILWIRDEDTGSRPCQAILLHAQVKDTVSVRNEGPVGRSAHSRLFFRLQVQDSTIRTNAVSI